jgi:hypothetical protein
MLGYIGNWASSKGMTKVPNLSGLNRTQAIAAITAAGLKHSGDSATTTNNLSLANMVASQIPNANELVSYETNVEFIYYNHVATTTTAAPTTAAPTAAPTTVAPTAAPTTTPAPTLATPTLSSSSITTNSAVVTITNYDASNSYFVNYGTRSGGTITITGLAPNSNYTVTVTASRPGYNSASNSISIQTVAVTTTTTSTQPPTTTTTAPPLSITSVSGTGTGQTTILASWTSTSQASYRVQAIPFFEGTGYDSGIINGSAQSITATGLDCDTSHTISVTVYSGLNGTGSSQFLQDNTGNARTSACTQTTTTTQPLLPAPSLSIFRSQNSAIIQINNHNMDNTYTSNLGSLADDTVVLTGLNTNYTATVTVTVSRSGYQSNSASINVPVYSTPAPTTTTTIAPATTTTAAPPVWYCSTTEIGGDGQYRGTWDADISSELCNSYKTVCATTGYPDYPTVPICATTTTQAPVATTTTQAPVVTTTAAPTPTWYFCCADGTGGSVVAATSLQAVQLANTYCATEAMSTLQGSVQQTPTGCNPPTTTAAPIVTTTTAAPTAAPTTTAAPVVWYCSTTEIGGDGQYRGTWDADISSELCNSYKTVCATTGYPAYPTVPTCATAAPTAAPTTVAPTAAPTTTTAAPAAYNFYCSTSYSNGTRERGTASFDVTGSLCNDYATVCSYNNTGTYPAYPTVPTCATAAPTAAPTTVAPTAAPTTTTAAPATTAAPCTCVYSDVGDYYYSPNCCPSGSQRTGALSGTSSGECCPNVAKSTPATTSTPTSAPTTTTTQAATSNPSSNKTCTTYDVYNSASPAYAACYSIGQCASPLAGGTMCGAL